MCVKLHNSTKRIWVDKLLTNRDYHESCLLMLLLYYICSVKEIMFPFCVLIIPTQ